LEYSTVTVPPLDEEDPEPEEPEEPEQAAAVTRSAAPSAGTATLFKSFMRIPFLLPYCLMRLWRIDDG
jgi:hypothetical protein